MSILRRKFSWIHDVMGFMDKNSLSYKVGTASNLAPLPNFQPLYRENQEPHYQVTKLNNGVRIFTETAPFPGSVNLGVLIETGSRDETLETSGMMMALKNTYLKSNSRTNEQLNYGIVQMSGGEFSMDYTQELTYYQGHCLSHDVYDFLQMMSDCILDEKTVMDEEAAMWRIDEYWKLREQTITYDKILEEKWLQAAYGNNGLGLPLTGFQSNFQNIGYYKMNSFRKHFITPERMIVCASGIFDHNEFVEAVRGYYEPLEPVKAPQRVKSIYKGGELREICESFMTYISVSFEGVPWKDPDMAALQVLKQIVGEGGGFSTGGPGKGMHSRAYTHILAKYPWIESVKATNSNFTDGGNFGLTIVCLNAYTPYSGEAIIKELIDLTRVTDQEVQRAKNCLKMQLQLTLEKSIPRLEDTVKRYSVLGTLPDENNYINMIDKVTTEQVRKAAAKVIKSKPSLVVLGGDTHAVPSADILHRYLGQQRLFKMAEDIASLRQQNEFLVMELDDCRLKIDHLSRVNESLTKIVQGSESGPLRDLTISEIEKTTQRYIRDLEEQKNRHRSQLEALEKQKYDLEMRVKDLTFEVKKFDMAKEQLEQEFQSQLEKMKNENDYMKKNIKMLEEDLQYGKDKEKHDLEVKLHEARLELELQKEMGRKDEMQIRNQSDEAIKKMKLLYAEEAEYLKEQIKKLQDKVNKQKEKMWIFKSKSVYDRSDYVDENQHSYSPIQPLSQSYQNIPGTFSSTERRNYEMLASSSDFASILQRKDNEIIQLKLQLDQIILQKERVEVELDKAMLELKQQNFKQNQCDIEFKSKETNFKDEIKFLIGKLLKAKSKLKVESELNETIRREGVVSMMRHRSKYSPSTSKRSISPINSLRISRNESPFTTEWENQMQINMGNKHYSSIVDAVLNSDSEFIQQYLEKGGDPNFKDKKGRSLMRIALYKQKQQIFEILYQADARILPLLHDGQTAMHFAVRLEEKSFIKFIARLIPETLN